jgi:hypothetical protein
MAFLLTAIPASPRRDSAYHEKVAVRAPGDDAITELFEQRAHLPRVADGQGLAPAKLVARRFPERHRLRGNHVHERPSLNPGEDGPVDVARMALPAEDEAAPGPAQRLVRRKGHEIGMRDGIRVLAGGDQSRVMRHVGQHQRVAGLRDASDTGEIDDPGVGARPHHDQARAVLHRQALHLGVV